MVNEPIQTKGFDKFGHAQFDYSRDKTTYQVKDTDTLLGIANQSKVGLQQLRFYNNIDKHTFAIRVGQTIHIPSAQVIIPIGK
ncbi:LysM peptidoglycan-binding domain-containing protein [Lentilactobacillus parabuchneri]|nr:LysM peptidoglycan-binding domain-containing protein [Lentilactobacillus buchneri]TLQ32203.1 LysM peptidoglycan-binding domain-containing protein [Lentilactobacillus parabuchneri]